MWEEEGGGGRGKVMSSHVENEELVVKRKVQLWPEAGRHLEKGGGGGYQGRHQSWKSSKKWSGPEPQQTPALPGSVKNQANKETSYRTSEGLKEARKA